MIHSPLVGPSSLTPTANALKELGVQCGVPLAFETGENIPRWRDWSAKLIDGLTPTDRPVIVGHSMGGLLAARLASELEAIGVICLDANMPPELGPTPTVDPEFHAFVKTLPLDNGLLPPWHKWWPRDVFEGTNISPALKADILDEIPRLRLEWFADHFDMPSWAETKRGYLRTSPVFANEAKMAEERGWTVIKLKGTHMHPAIEPIETAKAIMLCCQKMGVL